MGPSLNDFVSRTSIPCLSSSAHFESSILAWLETELSRPPLASAHGGLAKAVKALLTKGAFQGDIALEGQQAETLMSAHFGRHRKFSAVQGRKLKYIVNEYLCPCSQFNYVCTYLAT